jgi:hypothetical protein
MNSPFWAGDFFNMKCTNKTAYPTPDLLWSFYYSIQFLSRTCSIGDSFKKLVCGGFRAHWGFAVPQYTIYLISLRWCFAVQLLCVAIFLLLCCLSIIAEEFLVKPWSA